MYGCLAVIDAIKVRRVFAAFDNHCSIISDDGMTGFAFLKNRFARSSVPRCVAARKRRTGCHQQTH
jgi:hypothetical protein